MLLKAEAALYGDTFQRRNPFLPCCLPGRRKRTVDEKNGAVNLMAQWPSSAEAITVCRVYQRIGGNGSNDFICPFVAQMLQTDYYMWLA
jgi:hypothetical protein